VESAEALGGSFKLVTLVPKTVREMTQLPREKQKDGDTQQIKRDRKRMNKVLRGDANTVHLL